MGGVDAKKMRRCSVDPYRWVDKGRLYTQAYYNNRARVTRAKRNALLRRRGELLERSFTHACETGGYRGVRLRRSENVRKRYLMQVAAMNLGLVLRAMLRQGTPRGAAEARKGPLCILLVLGALVAAVRGLFDRLRTSRGHRYQAAGGGWYVTTAPAAGQFNGLLSVAYPRSFTAHAPAAPGFPRKGILRLGAGAMVAFIAWMRVNAPWDRGSITSKPSRRRPARKASMSSK